MVGISGNELIIATSITLANALVNLYWTFKLKSIQTHGEEVRSLREMIAMKEDLIRDKDEKIKRLEDRHHNMLLTHVFRKTSE